MFVAGKTLALLFLISVLFAVTVHVFDILIHIHTGNILENDE